VAQDNAHHGPQAVQSLTDIDPDDITLAVNGLDDLGCARVITQDLPQAADAHVDAAVEGVGVAPRSNSVSCVRLSTRLPDPSSTPAAGIPRRSGQGLAGSIGEGAGDGIQPPATEGKPRTLSGLGPAGHAPHGAGSP